MWLPQRISLGGEMGYHERLLSMIMDGTIADSRGLVSAKVALAREFGLGRVPSNSETLAMADEGMLAKAGPLLRRKPMRTRSGVAVVAVMTSPAPCPHGKCSYCPGGVDNGSPQSYTGKEPAARRAVANDFDPFRQVTNRLGQLESIGHPTDKVDLIIMGGTFTSREKEYQLSFVKGCFDGLNGEGSRSLEEAHRKNELSPHRCIGMTVETRPDQFDDAKASFSMGLGATRVELGVQILDDEVLRGVNRGHGVEEVVTATRLAKDRGLKVCYHIMPGLPGSNPDRDVERFSMIFEDERFRPDMIKIYPTLVVRGTALYEMWKKGEFAPYTTELAVRVIAEMKKVAPPYVRIQRIQRDIPAPLIEAGVAKGHLRQLVRDRMRHEGSHCGCIRCREVGLMEAESRFSDDVSLGALTYPASGGTEYFLSLDVQRTGALVGYARLRLDGGGAHLRELKVLGQMVPLGESRPAWQHKGYGKEIMHSAESIAREGGASIMRVTSGIGARPFYRSIGYSLEGVYMVKQL